MNQIIKSETRSFFGEGCVNCSVRNICLSPSRVLSEKRKFILSILGVRQGRNKYMTAGIEAHRKLQVGMKEMKDYGHIKFRKDLLKGKEITLSEVGICSPLNGYRGYIDRMDIQMDLKNKTVNIKITDYKAGWDIAHYIMQLGCYAMILNDVNCLVYYKKKLKTKNKTKNIPFKLFPFRDRILNIDGYIHNWKTGKIKYINMVKNNQLSDDVKNLCMGFMSKARSKRKYMGAGLYYLDKTLPCKWCKGRDEFCDLWSKVCSKIDYKEKSKQRYIGKKNLLVRTRPKFR